PIARAPVLVEAHSRNIRAPARARGTAAQIAVALNAHRRDVRISAATASPNTRELAAREKSACLANEIATTLPVDGVPERVALQLVGRPLSKFAKGQPLRPELGGAWRYGRTSC